MSQLKLNPDLFLETQEIDFLRKSLDEEGFRKYLVENTVKYGLLKNSATPSFTNSRVEADVDVLGQKAVKIKPISGVDTNGQFFKSKQINGIAIPSDNNWYWLKVNWVYSNLEEGLFTLAPNGDLIDTSGDAKLTKIFRGMPNFPVRIKFVGTTYNTLDYDVLEVIDDSHAIIQHPATNGSGIAAFEGESNLKIKIVGTFTPGISIPNNSRYIYNHDSVNISLIAEATANQSPVLTVLNDGIYGSQVVSNGFDLARVKSDGVNLIIQDKRTSIWETKGSNLSIEVSRDDNKLIGVEAVKYNDEFTPGDRNIVEVAWGIRTSNWTVDTANNIVTFNSGKGGKFKSVDDFTNGDLNDCRLYSMNGKYSRVISSVKQGSAINFILDVLDVNNFSDDGGVTFLSGELLVVPDCDSVELLFTPDPADNTDYIKEKFTFPVNTPLAKCDVLVYKDDTVLYNLKYRYKSFKEYTQWKPIPSDTVNGYYTEASFDSNGVLIPVPFLHTYTNAPLNGFIEMKLSPLSIYKFRSKVDKGDLIGVNQISDLTGVTLINLRVGIDKNYQYFKGDLVAPNDIYIDLGLANSIEGNEFRVHFECDSLDLAGSNIYIVEGYGTVDQRELKKISNGDIYAMLNQDGGILFDFKFKKIAGVGNWIMYQNYDLGRPFEIITVDGILDDLYDNVTGLGKVKGLFGTVKCDGTISTFDGVAIPDLSKRFLIGNSTGVINFEVGDTGGEEGVTLSSLQQGKIKAKTSVDDVSGGSETVSATININDVSIPMNGGANQTSFGSTVEIPAQAATEPHNNIPPYYAIIYAKKTF